MCVLLSFSCHIAKLFVMMLFTLCVCTHVFPTKQVSSVVMLLTCIWEEVCLYLGHNTWLRAFKVFATTSWKMPNCFQFIIHLSFYHSILYSLWFLKPYEINHSKKRYIYWCFWISFSYHDLVFKIHEPWPLQFSLIFILPLQFCVVLYCTFSWCHLDSYFISLFSLQCLVPCSYLYYQVIHCLFYLAYIWMLLSCVLMDD